MKRTPGSLFASALIVSLSASAAVRTGSVDELVNSLRPRTQAATVRAAGRLAPQTPSLPGILEGVDQAYAEIQQKLGDRHQNQMTLPRAQHDKVDSCRANQRSFGDAIANAIHDHLTARVVHLPDNVRKAYGLDETHPTPVSLMSHALCPVTDATLEHLLGKDFVPSKEVTRILQRFTTLVNEARQKKEADRVRTLYTALFGCIAYEEALAVPGDFGAGKKKMDDAFGEYVSSHESVRKHFEAKNPNTGETELRRPPGIIAYIDRQGGYAIEVRKLRAELEKAKAAGTYDEKMEMSYQLAITELRRKYKSWPVLGMFQFLPDGHGNIRACIESWNQLYPRCSIRKSSKDDVALALVSHGQTFNAFCGAQKLVHSFHSQIHTIHATGTDLANALPDGTLKPGAKRCLSLVSRSGNARIYSHFGPLRNSVKDNLGHVLKCTQRALELVEIK